MIAQRRERREIRFAYNRRGQLANAVVTSGAAALGRHNYYNYDGTGRLVSVADHEGTTNQYVYDSENRITSEARRRGAVYQFDYDDADRCVHVTGADGTNERHIKYDPVERITEERDSHGQPWLYEYNDKGQITKATTPTGATVLTQYDSEGRVVGEVACDKFTRKYEYDELGRKVAIHYPGDRTARIEYDDQHYAIGTTDSRGLRTAFERDERGLVTGIVLPDGRRIEREYDAHGDLVLERDPTGAAVRFAYDVCGRAVARQNALGMTWQYGYNELGLMVRKQAPNGTVTEFGYDSHQQPAWLRTPDGTTLRWVCEPNATYEHRSDGVTRYIKYSSCGQPVEVCDFSGNVSRFEWDTEQNRMLAFQTPSGGRHQFSYNADGDLIEHLSPAKRAHRYEWKDRRLVATIDAAGRRIDHEYDALGFLTKLSSCDGDIAYEFDPKHCALSKLTSPDTVIEHERDSFGIVHTTVCEGIAVHQKFEALHRLAELSTSLGDKTTFAYDPRGHLKEADFGFCKQLFSYDSMSREVGRELVGAGSLSMHYDDVGNLLQLAFSPGAKLALAAGAEWMSTPAEYERSYAWAPGHRLTRQIDTMRGWRRFVHGPTRRLMADDESSGQTNFYDYDGDGNRLFRAEVADNHDLLNLPFQAAQPLPWREIPGEVLRRGGRDTFYSYDEDGRLLEARGVEQSLQYEYDDAGYVMAKHVLRGAARQTWRFRWNVFGHLLSATLPSGEVWTYRYDGMGRRIAKVAPDGEVTRYVWHNANIIYEIKGSEVSFFAHHPGTNEFLGVRGKETGHIVCDHVGAPSELIGLDGQVKALFTRNAWGRRTDSIPVPQVFPGQYQDEETGLSYNFLRYYDPDVGRYLSPDPLGLRGGLNVYGYVPSPEQFIDPQGDIARRPGGPLVNIPPGDAEQPGRTQVNDPDKGHPYMGGHDEVDGQRVPLGGATVTNVQDGTGSPIVARAYNGGPEGDLTNAKAANVNSGASTDAWWHSEQNAMTAVIRGTQTPGEHGTITLSGDGPITFHISREPCCKCRNALMGEDGLAQKVANATGREVVLVYPTDEDPAMNQRETFPPKPSNCG
jgi:RHS repeat-associated protein